MTDKVQKIREEVERLKEIAEYNISHSKMDRSAWMQQAACCTKLLSFIDSMQEECNITGIKSKHATGKLKECIDNITDESLAKARKQLQEESKECMYSKDNYTAEDRKVLCEGCEEECKFNKKEEPINDSFEIEVKNLWMEINTGHNYSIVDSYNQFYGLCMEIAEWQKQKMNVDAIETSVCAMLDGIHIDILPKQLKGYRFGDKVKVIIIKED